MSDFRRNIDNLGVWLVSVLTPHFCRYGPFMGYRVGHSVSHRMGYLGGLTVIAFIEVASANVDERRGRNDNGPWVMRTQKAYLHQGQPYPMPFDIRLGEFQAPFQPGKYVFGANSFRSGKYGLEAEREYNFVPLDEAMKAMQEISRSARSPGASAA